MQRKLSRAKHGKRNPEWRDKARQKMAIGKKMGGDGPPPPEAHLVQFGRRGE
jgi:hypothetical protein